MTFCRELIIGADNVYYVVGYARICGMNKTIEKLQLMERLFTHTDGLDYPRWVKDSAIKVRRGMTNPDLTVDAVQHYSHDMDRIIAELYLVLYLNDRSTEEE